MKKRLVAFLCAVSLVASMGLPASAAENYTKEATIVDAFGEEVLKYKNARVVSEDYRQWEQSNEAWGSIPLGTSDETIESAGCLVTSVTKLIIQCGLRTPEEINPGILVEWLNKNNGFTEGGGLYWGRVSKFVKGFSDEILLLENREVSSVDYTDEILDWIEDGYHMVLWVRNRGHWVAVDEAMSLAAGEIYIMDSLPTAANNADIKLVDKYPSIYQVQAYTGGTTPEAAPPSKLNKCGDNLAWSVEEGVLTITGTGAMYDFDDYNAPWEEEAADITSVVIGDGVTTIGNNAFAGCSSLEAFAVADENAELSSVDGVLFNAEGTELICYPCAKTGTSYTIPEEVAVIRKGAFADCTGLEEITFAGDLPEIAADAFENVEAIVYYMDTWKEVPAETAFGAKKLTWTEYTIHTWDEGTVIKEATCEVNGRIEFVCEECEKIKEKVIPALGHDFQWIIDLEPTETEIGEKHEECTRCELVRNENSEIPEIGHTHQIEKVERVEPTCEKDGNVEYYYCNDCGRSYSEEEALHRIPAKNIVLEMTGHTWDMGVETRPTPSTEGYTTYTCENCEETKVEDVVPKLDEPERIAGVDRYETCYAIADAFKEKSGMEVFDTVVIASGENFADALAGSYLASINNAPILMTNGKNSNLEKLQLYLNNNLKDGGKVYILGGEVAVPKKIENILGGYEVKRLAGADRYATNLEILKEAEVQNEMILVATGTNFADSLSASAVEAPILLVGSSLNAKQKEFLNTVDSDFYILGGKVAVSETMESQLKIYGDVRRLGGSTRYETSVLIAQEFFTEPYYAVFAYAMNFPDGLCGGPLAMSMQAPLILTATGSEKAAVGYAEANGITSGIVLGGEKLISNNTFEKILGEE